MINIKDIIRFILQVREAFYIGTGNLASSVIGAIFWLLLASIVDSDVYGEINYYIAFASLFAVVSLLGLDIQVMTFLPKGNKIIFTESFILMLISSSIAALIIFIMFSSIFLALLVIGNNIFVLTIAETLGNKKYRIYPIIMLTNRILQLLLAIYLYIIFSIEGIIIGYAIPALIVGSLSIFHLQDIKYGLKLKFIRNKLKFAIYAYTFQISTVILIYIDKIILAPLFGFETLGLYQFAFQLLLFLAMIPMTLIQYLLPQEASNISKVNIKKIGLGLSILLSVIFFIASPVAINTFFPKYIEAIDAARIMAFGIVPMSINAIINAELLAKEKSKIVMLGSLAYIITLIILFIILGNMFDVMGLALAVVLSALFQSLVLLFAKIIIK
ncbi:MAG: hypothetical protein KatS3mg003_1919 [Candidatus Nitrosocaldaceae archaeon]|nr:MAG: hypothetical protein KatS3mg003_1919 [Candidatus Nitrosocaldaceae archaeon]